MKTALRLLTSALALVIVSAGMTSSSSASAAIPVITSGAKGAISGGGASFPNDQYQKWITDITALNPSVGFGDNIGSKLVLTYTKSSSGTGKGNFRGANARKASQMFSGTDSLVTGTDLSEANNIPGGWTQIPMTAGPLAVITNLPGVSANIRLDANVLCQIYSGQIKVWSDAKIRALNPTITALNTMNQTIVPVARDATSGTTFIFVSFLATGRGVEKKCGYTSDWTNDVTSFSSISGTLKPADAIMATRFSAMRGANGAGAIQGKTGNDGVRNYVAATAYSVGYVEMAYSFATGIKQAAIATADLNTSGTYKGKPNYLLPTVDGATAALSKQNTNSPGSAVNPSSTYVQPVNQAGLATYPIVGYSWVLIYKGFDSTISGAPTLGQVEGLIYFLNWSVTKGAVYKAGTTPCYSPLPASVKTLVIAELKKIKYDNVTVWR
jgi:phosphate transport system substrate-binding protein